MYRGLEKYVKKMEVTHRQQPHYNLNEKA